MRLNGEAIDLNLETISSSFLRGKSMSLKNSQAIEDKKHEYIYHRVYKNGRRSFKSLDKFIKKFEL